MVVTKHLDVDSLLRCVVEPASIKAVGTSDPFKGSQVLLDWDGTWRSELQGGFLPIERIPQGQLTLDSPMGTLLLDGAFVRQLDTTGRVEGLYNRLVLTSRSGEHSTPRYRTYVRVADDLIDKIHFPARYTYGSTENMGYAHALLPLRGPTFEADIFFLKEGPFLVVDAPGMEGTRRAHMRLSGGIRQLMSYLTGIGLASSSCVMALDESSGEVLETHYFPGSGMETSIYHPIPCSWSEWRTSRHTTGLEDSEVPLHFDIVARMLEAYRANRLLVTPVEYLLRFSSAPLEMRGAMLALALESLTDILQRAGVLKAVNPAPLDDVEWKTTRKALGAVLQAVSGKWTEKQRNVLQGRLDNLNRPSNQDKLTLPFDALGVQLGPEEFQAISKRNTLLHTGRLMMPELEESTMERRHSVYNLEMRLYTAVNKLLLKHLGYQGPIIDWGATGLGSFERVYARL